ncbi:GNAT family N-acetyltransferase [Aliiroseovarius subalbicans]|uniref:GNAT family N-acetyltransferase n=1 Tax=Aliiroseovarius subalbicans TaxID=2925840 RepID=UPI001F59029D|nr:GNAT family N-acetyltransferase [Aliiroseovarius subalbicans]MCI2399756.1 GNAT family N-acetyltransferase [Aliiroseovarius subalbicans]
MSVSIEPGDPRDPQATALLRQSHALMESLFPPEDNHFLDIEELCVPQITFFVARHDETVLGTAALANKGSYGEVKSMFVSPDARGLGLGMKLLDRLEAHASVLGLSALKLETGSLLHEAHRLYARGGFAQCGPFGDYEANSSSLFMEKTL